MNTLCFRSLRGYGQLTVLPVLAGAVPSWAQVVSAVPPASGFCGVDFSYVPVMSAMGAVSSVPALGLPGMLMLTPLALLALGWSKRRLNAGSAPSSSKAGAGLRSVALAAALGAAAWGMAAWAPQAMAVGPYDLTATGGGRVNDTIVIPATSPGVPITYNVTNLSGRSQRIATNATVAEAGTTCNVGTVLPNGGSCYVATICNNTGQGGGNN